MSKYSIVNGDETVKTLSKKPEETAVRALAKELGSTLQVLTAAGNVVLEVKPRKPQVKTKPYTRVETLPEDFRAPEGFVLRYKRSRKGIAIAHNPETGEYRVVNAKGKALAKGLSTTREAGAFCKTVPLPEQETVDA